MAARALHTFVPGFGFCKAVVRMVAALVIVAGHAAAQTTIEVYVDGGYAPLEKSVVSTCTPSIRIVRDVDVPSGFQVLLVREDQRAGYDGLGKPIPAGPPGPGILLAETAPGSNEYVGVIEVLVGFNELQIQPPGGGAPLVAARMLNYSAENEDLNGNLLLDGDEDADGDLVLDISEDSNGNQLLDYNEDRNGNGLLDLSEDIDDNDTLSPGEDVNGNNLLDKYVPVDASVDIGSTAILHPLGHHEHGGIVILAFAASVSDRDIGDFLRGEIGNNPFDLEPVAITVSPNDVKMVTARIVGGGVPHEIARILNGQGEGDFLIPPGFPPPPPLSYAVEDGLIVPAICAGERFPQRLMRGAAPNAGQGYVAANGSFDDSGNNPDELDAAWHHFYLQTFAAHRLMEVLPFPAAPLSLGVIDSGFGNGAAALPDIANARVRLPHNIGWGAPMMGVAAAVSAPVANILAIPETNAVTHGTWVSALALGDGTQFTLGAGRRSTMRPIRLLTAPPAGAPAAGATGWTQMSNSLVTAAADATTVAINFSWRYPQPAQVVPANPVTGALALTAQQSAWLRNMRTRAVMRPGITAVNATNMVFVVCSGNESEDVDFAFPALFQAPSFAGTAIDDDGDGVADNDGLDGLNNDGDNFPVMQLNPAGMLVNVPWIDEDPAERALTMAVTATGLTAIPGGVERHATSFSNTGQRVMVSAPGQAVRSVQGSNPYAFSAAINGCSFATPLVSGAITELINLASALPAGLFSGGGVTAAQRNLRVSQIVAATADDLGSAQTPATPAAAPGSVAPPGPPLADHVANLPGNGPDNDFGIGRLNLWKATLSVVNQGLAAQHARDTAGGGNGFDDRFTQLPTINDANTLWYGFEIVCSVPHATVWIDGGQLADNNANNGPDGVAGNADDVPGTTGPDGIAGNADDLMPNAPNVSGFRGVRSDTNQSRGVQARSDGSQGGDNPGANSVVDDLPLTGIVPVGTRTNNRGEYVITFSIQRSDLYDGANPRTLSLRLPGQTVDDKPFYNLRLETAKMRGEGNPPTHVSGVVFDDFVFTINVPDYGDYFLGPTVMTDSGPRHHNTALEWLGRRGAGNLASVTGEANAGTEPRGGDSRVDVDGVENVFGLYHDSDGRDDGVVFFPLTYRQFAATGKVQFTIGVADAGDIFTPGPPPSGRYSRTGANADPDRSLFFNLWIDWNGNGQWDAVNFEHVLNGVQITPAGGWTVLSSGAGGATVTRTAVSADGNSATFECVNLPTGFIQCGSIWARARLDFGENVGRNDPRPPAGAVHLGFRSLPSLRDPGLALNAVGPGGAAGALGLFKGAARFGEVEDYFIGSDFGDAPDDECCRYPTLLSRDGAHHLQFHREWLGEPHCCFPFASREKDANDANSLCGLVLGLGTDQDGVANLAPEDTDGADDGFEVSALQFFGPLFLLNVKITTCASELGVRSAGFFGGMIDTPADAADSLPRYDHTDPRRRLYLSAWADWNDDGTWEEAEKVVDEVVDPQDFGANGAYTLGEEFADANGNGVWDEGEFYVDEFGVDTTTKAYLFAPNLLPPDLPQKVWFRLRLAYGEDDATFDLQVKEADADGRALNQERGGAIFGEVEDFVINTDDTCYFAQIVGEGIHTFDTTTYRPDGPDGGCNGSGPDIWFVYEATCTGTAFIDTSPTGFDTVLDVYNGDDCDAATLLACNDNEPFLNGPTSYVEVPVIGGARYLIRVAGKGMNDKGGGTLRISCKPAGPILYVNQNVVGGTQSGDSWANAIPRLERALQMAANSIVGSNPPNVREIWVATGVYKPTQDGDRAKTFSLVNGVGVYGGFDGTELLREDRDADVNVTILTGDLSGNDFACFGNNDENSFHVVTSIGANDPATELDGFIIEGGNADGTAGILSDRGGNMFIQNGFPRIRDCLFRHGSAKYGGGAIYMNELARPVISWCTFTCNRATDDCGNCGGAAIYGEDPGTTPYIANCTVFGNQTPTNPVSGDGGGAGGGMFFRHRTEALVVNCYIHDNEANAGGGVCTALGTTQPPQVYFINCTIRDNRGWVQGGGAYIYRADTFFLNTIFWGNQAPAGPQVSVICPAAPTFDECDVQGGAAAVLVVGGCGLPNYNAATCINANPLFAADGSILPGSPCADVGNQNLLPVDIADVDTDGNFAEAVPLDRKENARVVGVDVDMGAFEIQNNMNPVGACCVGAVCSLATQAGCLALGGIWLGAGRPCDPNPCPVVIDGACCLTTGCVVNLESECISLGGVWQGLGTNCVTTSCPSPIGACCETSGICSLRNEQDCLTVGGTWLGAGTNCIATSCPAPVGACCIDSQTCIPLNEQQCLTQLGTWSGPGTSCLPSPCAPTGGCCFPGGGCAAMTSADCALAGGLYLGDGVPCGPDTCIPRGCSQIRGDANCDGTVDFFDIDAFLMALFDPGAYVVFFCGGDVCSPDANCDGSVDFFDIDPFIDCLFNGCGPCVR